MSKTYLGDAVYAELNKYGQIVLTTGSGRGPSNTIYLEPEAYLALTEYVERQARKECSYGPADHD